MNKRSKTGSTVGNINIFTNISEGTAFLLQGVTYDDGVELRRRVQYDAIITCEKVN